MTTLVHRPQKKQMRVSVIVPCCAKHVHLLPELLARLHEQSRRPDEVIVAVSGCETFASAPLPINTQILYSPSPLTAGQNRNRASDVATGDIFIYQDADDIPHLQRVAIIAELFETYEVEHLMHHYVRSGTFLSDVATTEVTARSSYSLEPVWHQVTSGNVAIAQLVFDAIRWPEYALIGEDQEFNREVYGRFKRTVVTELSLLVYRQEFSSFR